MGEVIPLFGADDDRNKQNESRNDLNARFAEACIPAPGCEDCEVFQFYADELPQDIMHGLQTTEQAIKYMNTLRDSCLAARALTGFASSLCPNSTPMG